MNDIIFTDTLAFENGDFKVGRSDEQHQKHILQAHKGDFKQFPELGVGITDYLNDDEPTSMLIAIKKQMQYDGMQVKNVRIDTSGKLMIDGHYKNKDNG